MQVSSEENGPPEGGPFRDVDQDYFTLTSSMTNEVWRLLSSTP